MLCVGEARGDSTQLCESATEVGNLLCDGRGGVVCPPALRRPLIPPLQIRPCLVEQLAEVRRPLPLQGCGLYRVPLIECAFRKADKHPYHMTR
eukprot:gene3803-biopygen6510